MDNRSAAGVRGFAGLHSTPVMSRRTQGFTDGPHELSEGWKSIQPRSGNHGIEEQPWFEDGYGAYGNACRSGEPPVGVPVGAYVTPGKYRSPGDRSERPSEAQRSERPSEAQDIVHAVATGMKGVIDGMMEKFTEIQWGSER